MTYVWAAMGLLVMGMGAQRAFAQDKPCGGGDEAAAEIQGAATFDIQSGANPCKGPAVDTSFGPFPRMNSTAEQTTTKILIKEDFAEESAPEPVEDEAGGIRQDFNGQQMRRVGELDARQGRPLNMLYANDLNYLQGYTDCQKQRYSGAGAGQATEPRRGFSGF